MAKESSVAPKERVNIVYKSNTGDTEETVELPLKQLVVGNFANRELDDRFDERKAVSVDKDNFNNVLEKQEVRVNLSVANQLSDEPDAQMSVDLDFKHINDFGPEAVAGQVPELQKILKLREALLSLKGPLSNIPEFRKKLQTIIDDATLRDKLLEELGITVQPEE